MISAKARSSSTSVNSEFNIFDPCPTTGRDHYPLPNRSRAVYVEDRRLHKQNIVVIRLSSTAHKFIIRSPRGSLSRKLPPRRIPSASRRWRNAGSGPTWDSITVLCVFASRGADRDSNSPYKFYDRSGHQSMSGAVTEIQERSRD